MINSVMLVGHLGKDAEIRSTSTGTSLASFSVATSESWRDRNSGEWKEKTEWHKVTAFGADAFITMIGDRGRKGALVMVQGKLQTRKWQDNRGEDRYTTEIVIDQGGKLKFLDKREDAGGQRQSTRRPEADDYGYETQTQTAPAQQRAAASRARPAPVNEFDDEIPF